MNLIQKITKGFRWVTAGAFVKFGLQMAQVLVLVQFLTKEEMGLFSILMIVVGMAQFFSDLGISTGLVHFQDLTKRQLNTLYWLNIFSGIIVTGILWGGANLAAQFYESYEIIPLIQWGSLVFLIRPIGQQFQYLFQKEMDFSSLAKIEIVVEIVTFLIIVYALVTGNQVFAVIYGLISGAIVYAILFFYFGRKFHQPTFMALNIKECKPVLKFGVYQMGERLLNYLNFNIDKIFVGSCFGLATLGAYELAHQLVWRPFGFLSFINGKLTYPFYSKLQNDFKELNIRFLQNIALFTFVAYPIYFGMCVGIEEIVFVLFGEGWETTVLAFQALFLLAVWMSSATLVGAYYLSLGKAKYGFYLTFYALFVSGISLFVASEFEDLSYFILIYVLGVMFLQTPVLYQLRYNLTRLHIIEYVHQWLPNLLISLSMFGILFIMKYLFYNVDNEWFMLLSLGVIGTLFYVLMSYFFRKKILIWILGIIKR